jgi:hypothetical protein
MPKLMRGLVLGAMLAVMGSATAAVAQTPPDSRNEAVQQFRAGERASQGQPVSGDEAVQRFWAGERASIGQPTTPVQPAQPGGQPDRDVVVLSILAVVAVLVLSLDAISVRRKARKAAHPAI